MGRGLSLLGWVSGETDTVDEGALLEALKNSGLLADQGNDMANEGNRRPDDRRLAGVDSRVEDTLEDIESHRERGQCG